ncbi:ATP-binding cassette domain-containing protein [Hazenella sp. IB182353]|uniref:ATP-binding cassette domain-containing protein n=1 Tax=Polycladospora coralii TaxID=2771432 RepID=UPI001746C70E|nr:ATP-binding cassette domain-containing protein [Polycladospora coralii]MBS7531114.1 ATP-binding cassette domain-containing protein [Polycladospora coralii]
MKIDWIHLTKQYDQTLGSRLGLLDFSASIQTGNTVVLGEKGAGKSTLLRLTSTRMIPDDGRIVFTISSDSAFIWSKSHVRASEFSNINLLNEKMSYVPKVKRLDKDTAVEMDLKHRAYATHVSNPKKRVVEAIAKWGLAAYRHTPLHHLQGEVLNRYLLAHSLISDPLIWILDEPTLELDEMSKKLLCYELQQRHTQRITLIATSDMHLAECADDLILLDRGMCRRYGKKKLLTAGVREGTVAAWYKAMQVFTRVKSSHP